MSAPLDKVHDALGRAGCQGKGANWQCPAHDDQSPSLSVKLGDKGVVLKCHGGCTAEQVVAALGLSMSDLFFAKAEGNGRAEVTDTYTYTDADGTVLFQTARLFPKDFRQRRPDGSGGWEWGIQGVRRVLYRLPEVVAAVAAGEPVWVVEGERDADRMTVEGVTATTCPMGAGKWRTQYSESLRGARVFVVADRDKAGYAHAAQVADSLALVDADVTVVEAATGKDASDHLGAGHGLDEFVSIDPAEKLAELDGAATGEPDAERGDDSAADLLEARLLTAEQLADLPAPVWLVSNILGLDNVALAYGKPGGGKTFVALDLALCVATGVPWHGHETRQGRVLYVAAEGVAGLNRRVRAWAKGRGVDPADIDFLPCAVNLLDATAAALEQVVTRKSYVLVVIDTLARSMVGGDENSARDMGQALDACDRIRRAAGCTVLLVHHDTKAGGTPRGSSALLGACDTVVEVGKDCAVVALTCEKQKDAEQFPAMSLELVAEGESCVLVAHVPGGVEVGGSDHLVLQALADIDTGSGVTATMWSQIVTPDPCHMRTYYRARKRLIERGLCHESDSTSSTRYTITDQGRQALKAWAVTQVTEQ